MNAVGYIRVSTEEQGDSGLGLQAQRRAVMAYATARGMDLVRIYEDVESGGSIGRKALTALRGDVQASIGTERPVNCLLVLKVDRLARVALDVLQLIHEFRDAGVEFVAVSEGIDTTTPMGKAMLTIVATFAELERENGRERTKRAMKVLKDSNMRCGSTPYGFRPLKNGGLMPYPPEIEVMDTIYRLRYVLGYSFTGISRYLHRHGIEVTRTTVYDRLRSTFCMPFLEPSTREAAERKGVVTARLPERSLLHYDPEAEIARKEKKPVVQ